MEHRLEQAKAALQGDITFAAILADGRLVTSEKKGIAPKTKKGCERLDAAMSIENRVEDLIRNFETEKKRDEKQVEAPVMENEARFCK